MAYAFNDDKSKVDVYSKAEIYAAKAYLMGPLFTIPANSIGACSFDTSGIGGDVIAIKEVRFIDSNGTVADLAITGYSFSSNFVDVKVKNTKSSDVLLESSSYVTLVCINGEISQPQ